MSILRIDKIQIYFDIISNLFSSFETNKFSTRLLLIGYIGRALLPIYLQKKTSNLISSVG